jgi:NAD(P)-dependent dehydrogenase (short-subunit alcohol dehydrogenase family)
VNLFDLTNKVAVVTGATRGLGHAIAEAYLRAGASVVISSENATDTKQVEVAFKDAGYKRVVGIVCDVTNDLQQQALLDAAITNFGGIDILVANAGIADGSTGSVDILRGVYDRVMDVNLNSVVRLCAATVPLLKARNGGAIILMSSLAAVRGNKSLGPYALSKAALAQLARNLAVELGPFNIRANAIAPGFIRTDLAKPLLADEQFMARRMQNTPLRRPGEPHEVAAVALFLAAPSGAFVTGQTILVDGGTSITDGS